jgi:N utilization substance protein B
MTERREAREWAVQLLFQRDFNSTDLDEAIAEFWRDKSPSDRARTFTEALVHGVEANRVQIDNQVQRYAENWDLGRMAAVDRNILRLAVFEMLFRDDIPPVVTINEAVDLAKDFSGLQSGKFVNGILDRICQNLDRPTRSAIDSDAP